MDKKHQNIAVASLLIVLALSLSSCFRQESTDVVTTIYPPSTTGIEAEVFTRFENEIESIRQGLRVPGLSAGIVKDQELIWAKGFGYADLKKESEAAPETPYPLASLTKPFAAAIIMQLVEEGVLRLDDPISQYGIDFSSDGVIELRHVLSHTSNGQPGTEFQYNGDRFADLGYLIKNAAGRSFRELLDERILVPLEMTSTAPNPISMGDGIFDVFGIWLNERNARVYRRTAKAYRLDQDFIMSESECPDLFTPAAGLNASVEDIAKFDAAMDEDILLKKETRELMFAPTISNSGAELPYGIGWFTQEYEGQRLIWHYGWQPNCGSSLILKMPYDHITLIALANSDNLSRPFRLGSGEVLAIDSPLALAFYKYFIFENQHDLVVPRLDWDAEEDDLITQLKAIEDENVHKMLQRELLSYRKLFDSVGRTDQAEKLLNIYERVYESPSSRLENDMHLLELGAPPWLYLPFPEIHHIPILVFFILIALSIFILWPVQYGVAQLRAPKRGFTASDRTHKAARTARMAALLAVLICLVVIVLYVSYLGGYPNGGPMVWSGGTPSVKILIAMANLSLIFSIALIGFAILVWRNRYWTFAWQIHYIMITIAVLGNGYVWQQLSLLGWI